MNSTFHFIQAEKKLSLKLALQEKEILLGKKMNEQSSKKQTKTIHPSPKTRAYGTRLFRVWKYFLLTAL